ncbi:MAG TPA: hypothetical protein VIL06_02425, partial [Coriobacteriia bacterium]
MNQNRRHSPQSAPHAPRDSAPWRRALLGAESRWPAFAAAFVIVIGQSLLASRLQLQPVWLLPSVAAVLLVASVGFYISPSKPDRLARVVSVGLVTVLVVTNIGSFIMLARDVFLGSALTPTDLLASGVSLWVVNVLVFAIVYWEMDGGGPETRLERRHEFPDLVFPQQQADQEKLTRSGWEPSFGDYLYLALTNGTAFSPTDAMPYTKRAKLAMGVQSVLSLAIAAIVVARAVNIAKG